MAGGRAGGGGERNAHTRTCTRVGRRARHGGRKMRAEMFSPGQHGVTLGIQSKLSPPSLRPLSLSLSASALYSLSLLPSFSLFCFSGFLSLDRPTVCLPTYLSTCSLALSLSSASSSSTTSSSFSSFSSCSPFFARCQVRSLYSIGPSYNPSTPFPFAQRSNFAVPLDDSAPPFVHELGRGSVSLSLSLSCSLV